MKSLFVSFLHIFSAILFFAAAAFGQAQLQLGAGGALLLPAADYKGSTKEYYTGANYGLSSGLGFHLKSRFEFGGLPFFAQIEYFIVTNKGEAEPGVGQIDIKQRLFAIKAGPEYHVDLQALSAIGYVGANVAMNNIGGDVSFQGVPRVSSTSYITNAVARLGVGLTAGVLVPLNPTATFDIGLAYNFINPFSKSWSSDDPNKRDSSYLTLNDAPDPLYAANDNKHFIQHSRSIQAFVLTISVLFAI